MMTCDTRKSLRKLARHERDEQASRFADLSNHRDQLERRTRDLEELIGETERGLVRRIDDALERSVLLNYLTSLRRQLEDLQVEREAVTRKQIEAQRQLRRRVVEYRQMEHLVQAAEETAVARAARKEERRGDDLATGSWHRARRRERGE